MAESGVFEVKGASVPYEVVRHGARCARLEFRGETLVLFLPPGEDPNGVLSKHRRWIFNCHSRIRSASQGAEVADLSNRSQAEFERLVRWFVEYYSKELAVKVKKVEFRDMKSKWGSCSSSGTMRINSRMRHLPERLIRYVVYHEVSHLVSMDHSGEFYDVVEKRYVDRKELDRGLAAYWLALGRIYGD